MSRASKVVEVELTPCPEVTEMCCGAACDREKRDIQLKLLGVAEYLIQLKRTTPLTEGQVYVLDAVASEYKMVLIPLN